MTYFNFSKLCGTFLLHTNVKSHLKIHLKDLYHPNTYCIQMLLPRNLRMPLPILQMYLQLFLLKKKERKKDKKAFLHKANEQEIWVACKARFINSNCTCFNSSNNQSFMFIEHLLCANHCFITETWESFDQINNSTVKKKPRGAPILSSFLYPRFTFMLLSWNLAL